MGHKIGSARAAPTLGEWFGGLEVAGYVLIAWKQGRGLWERERARAGAAARPGAICGTRSQPVAEQTGTMPWV